ncbi:hypothetical protein [Nostoc sp.]|uniref:hypothetical protein n=1 Tax=Nostoc sp. TaxID=1180 RepID=UPI002FF27C76
MHKSKIRKNPTPPKLRFVSPPEERGGVGDGHLGQRGNRYHSAGFTAIQYLKNLKWYYSFSKINLALGNHNFFLVKFLKTLSYFDFSYFFVVKAFQNLT